MFQNRNNPRLDVSRMQHKIASVSMLFTPAACLVSLAFLFCSASPELIYVTVGRANQLPSLY